MLLVLLAAIALTILAYYIFGSEESEETERTSAPPTREQSVAPKKVGKGEKPNVHIKKVRNKVKGEYKISKNYVQSLEKEKDLRRLARESYVLAESLRKMFLSDQFFEKRRRFDSFHTAIEAAEDARDKLIDRQKKEVRQADIASSSATDYVTDKYVRNATESALMIAWCAGGLIGKSRYESAQEAFRVSVSPEDVQNWKRFGQLLRKESHYYIVDPSDSE